MSISRQSPTFAYFSPGEGIPGTKLRVERVLGRGGQGEVHLVVNEVSRQKQVIKLLHPELVRNEGAMARFVKEVQLMAMLVHPHIVKLLHTDVTTAEGTRPALPYLLMENLDGDSLAGLLAGRGSLRWKTAVRLFAEIAEALAYSATKVGLVHRDIKPANLFIARDAEGRAFAKVLDFGISQLCEALTSVTSDDFLGTEHYAAPEQYTGRTSPKTDVYQLGLVIWETFAGHHPYHDKTTRQAIMYAQLEQVPPPLASVVEACPRALSKLVEGMLDKDPRKRPTMEVVASTLRDLEADGGLAGREIVCGRAGEEAHSAPAPHQAVALANTEVMASPPPKAPARAPLFAPPPADVGYAATMKSAGSSHPEPSAPPMAAPEATPAPKSARLGAGHAEDADAEDPGAPYPHEASAPSAAEPPKGSFFWGMIVSFTIVMSLGAIVVWFLMRALGLGPFEGAKPRQPGLDTSAPASAPNTGAPAPAAASSAVP